MNFKEIISNTTHYNFHSHTQYCDGRAPMRAMADAAVAAGMRHYGFTPHSPVPIVSPCNMASSDVPVYLAEVHRISNDISPEICRFYAGMEVDYLGNEWGPANEYFRALNLDYIIGSVHFIPSQSGELVDIDGRFESFRSKMHEHFHDDIDYVVDTFYSRSLDMISAGGFDILGHFDKIGQNASYFAPGIEDSMEYRRYIDNIINQIINRRLTIELNTKAREEHGRFFPSLRWIQPLIDADITILVNSDAHYPHRVDASRAEAVAALKTLGYAALS